MPRVLILGGTGPSGIFLIRKFFKRYPDGNAVLYARDPSKFPEDITSNANVVVVKGELKDEKALESGFSYGPVDAVLSTLGPIPFSGQQLDLPGAYKTILKLMDSHGSKRFIALSTISNDDPRDKFSLARWLIVFLVWATAHSAWKNIVDSAAAVRETSTQYGIDYVLVRVPMLTSTEGQKAVAGYIGDGKTGSVLSRYAAAEFFVDQIEGNEWLNKQPAISSTAK